MNPNINAGLGLLMAQSLTDQTTVDTTGRFFIVCGASDTNANEIKAMYQNYPDGASVVYTTVKLALAACLASRGDVIFVVAGHTENITNATDFLINVAGVTIIGLGSGSSRPAFTCTTATTASLTVSANNCTLQNVIVNGTGFAAVVSALTVTGTGFTLRGCNVVGTSATNQAGISLTATGADNLSLLGNSFTGTTDAGMTNAIQLIGGNDISIIGNYFFGAYTTSLGAINNITTACLRINIKDNVMINATASATKAVVMLSTSTGMISNNRVGIGSGAAPFTFAAGWWSGNWSAAAVATNGTLV